MKIKKVETIEINGFNWTTYFDIYDEFGFKAGKYYRFKIVL